MFERYYVYGTFDVIIINAFYFLKCIIVYVIPRPSRGAADVLERNPCIHKCETSASITKGPWPRWRVARNETGRKRVRTPFGDFSSSGGEKRVICSNERHKNILCNARGRRKEKLT